MGKIIEEVSAMGLGYRMGRNKINRICDENCADDADLIAETEDDLQRHLHKLHLTVGQVNMNILE